MKFWEFDGRNFVLDPDSLFWVVYEDCEDYKEVMEKVVKKLKKDLEKYRFEVEIKTLYANITDILQCKLPLLLYPRREEKKKS